VSFLRHHVYQREHGEAVPRPVKGDLRKSRLGPDSFDPTAHGGRVHGSAVDVREHEIVLSVLSADSEPFFGLAGTMGPQGRERSDPTVGTSSSIAAGHLAS